MITKLKEWARSAGSYLLSELSDYSVKRGLIVGLGVLAAKHGLEQEHANVLAEAIIGGVMVWLSRAEGKSPAALPVEQSEQPQGPPSAQ